MAIKLWILPLWDTPEHEGKHPNKSKSLAPNTFIQPRQSVFLSELRHKDPQQPCHNKLQKPSNEIGAKPPHISIRRGR
jgi:hypothetical protein